MKLIVAGSRTFMDKQKVFDFLDKGKEKITEIVSGLAKGPDSFGKEWAEINGIPVKEFPADWDNLGRKAGPIRNCQMGDYADALVAFWDGESKGTKHMIEYATKKNLKVKIITGELANE